MILYGERLVSGPARRAGRPRAARPRRRAWSLGGRDGAGLLCVPAPPTAAAWPRPACCPTPARASPALARPGRDAAAIAAARARGRADRALPPARRPGHRPARARRRGSAALERATTVIAHADFLTDGIREHATVVFPAESYAEKEGTRHAPRRAPAAPARGHRPPRATSRAEWSVLAELARRVGLDLGVLTGPMATAQLVAAVPFYAGLTLDEIGGRGVRWPARDAAARLPGRRARPRGPSDAERRAAGRAACANGRLRLGTFRSIWNATEVRGLARAALPAPAACAWRWRPPTPSASSSSRATASSSAPTGRRSTRRSPLRAATPEGSVFLETNALEGPLVEVRKA